MIGLVARRIGWSIVVVWFVVTTTFAMTAAIPADPIKALLGPHATPETIERVRVHYCLDKGLIGQYGCYALHIVHGDLGESYRSKRPVSAIIADRVWPTAQLALAAILLQLLVGVPLGVIAAIRRNRWPDHAANIFGLIGQSAPTFFIGTLLLYVFAYRFGWFPIGGYGVGFWDRMHHLVLPAATLATVGVAYYSRVVRSEMVEVLSEDYVRTARAKGLGERRVVYVHALRNALLPVITIAGLQFGSLLSGAIIVEKVFARPGLGKTLLDAISERDYPVVQGAVLVIAVMYVLVNMGVDLAYGLIDPRIRRA